MKRRILSIDEYVNEERMFESNLSEYQAIAEAENLREEYQKYFKETLETFGAKSLGELAREDRSDFFKKIKEGWEKGKGRKGSVSEGAITDDEYKKAVETKKACEDKLLKCKKECDECDDPTRKIQLEKECSEMEEKIKECDAKISGYNGPLKEGKIESDEDFKEYAENKLKIAFGDKFDQKKADDVINGLLKKKEDDDLDYGAIIGMLNK